jgi:hypothetical protein
LIAEKLLEVHVLDGEEIDDAFGPDNRQVVFRNFFYRIPFFKFEQK